MKLRYWFVFNALVVLIFAVGLLLAPKTMLSLLGLSLSSAVSFGATTNFVTQLLGAALIGLGLQSWFASGLAEVSARRASAISLFVFQVIGFALSLLGMFSHLMSVMGWALVGIFLLLALGYAYFLFMRQSEI